MITRGSLCEKCGTKKMIFCNYLFLPLHVIMYYVMQRDIPLYKILGCKCSDEFEESDDSVIRDFNSHLFVFNYMLNLDTTPPSPKSPLDMLD